MHQKVRNCFRSEHRGMCIDDPIWTNKGMFIVCSLSQKLGLYDQFPVADLDGHGSRGGKAVASSVPTVPGFAQLLRWRVFVLSSTSNHSMVVSSTSSTWSICWVASVLTGWEA